MDNPEFIWGYSYFAPANALVIRQIATEGHFINNFELYVDQKVPFLEVYSGTVVLLYTNSINAHAEYTERIDMESLFPIHFGKALAAQLSIDIAPSLITNNFPKIKDALNKSAENDITTGIADDLNKMPQHQTADSTFVRVRRRC
jgi:hypothetical protein